MTWTLETSNGNESAKIRNRLSAYLCGKGLDLGCGPWKILQNAGPENNCIGVDIAPGADIVHEIGKLDLFNSERFDFVFSSHALEDFPYQVKPVLSEWWRLVKPGGYLILYLPLTRQVAKQMGREDWENFYPNIGEEGSNINHHHDFHPDEIDAIMREVGHAELREDEVRVEGNEYSFLKVYRKLSSSVLPITRLSKPERPQKRALVIRYGAIGDCIHATAPLRLIKQRGYHVTFSTSPVGADIVRHNPHVDEVAIQLGHVVPNAELGSYWKELEKHYDLFVNLTGAAEDNILIGDRKLILAEQEIQKKHPEWDPITVRVAALTEFRKIAAGRNYYDEHLRKAGLEERGLNGELYFSPNEEFLATNFRANYRNQFLILWSLSGSAYHKLYPYFQQVVQQVLLDIPEAVVVSVGDETCIPMERVGSLRYIPRAGMWPVRFSLIMTKYADLVVGSETGILNAAGCFPTPKITLLSHSTHENLCRYWENDFCLAPNTGGISEYGESDVFCHPCHTLHYYHPRGKTRCITCDTYHEPDAPEGTPPGETCPYIRDMTDTPDEEAPRYPLCTARGIHPQRVVKRIKEVYQLWKESRCPIQSESAPIAHPPLLQSVPAAAAQSLL